MLGEARLLTIDDSGAVGIALTAAVSTATGDPDALPITVEPDRGVRFGLTAIKNVGEGAIASLLGVRKTQERIRSLPAIYPAGLTPHVQVALGSAVLLTNAFAYAVLIRRLQRGSS